MPPAFWTDTYRGYDLVQQNEFGPIEIWFQDEYIETPADGHYRAAIDGYLDAA